MDCKTNERITQLRKELGLSQTAFGEKLGVSRGVIKNIDEQNTIPKQEFLSLICKVYNVDPYWLKTGDGEMFLGKDEFDELMEFAAEIGTSRDLEWVKQLVLTLKRLSPEQRAEVSKFVTGLAGLIAQNKEKEQD